MSPTLYILYNADASLLGKLNYSYRKITCKKDNPACAACDITHGGLHLEETREWKEVKARLVGEGVEVRQVHRDEVGGFGEVNEFVEKEKPKFPVVLGRGGEGKGDLRVLMDKEELAGCGGDGNVLVEKLREKGVLGGERGASL
ncbi:hypothetical protein ACLMJK_000777 [Lecanora helva]